ncbi:ABC transporter ATP-binding protein [Paenibacillus crassostreae]|uniref:Peptide ABC transporter ATP-binding protein n=1 Tax=Paenibacillus crassostreae TaxID=1763538 RepID=A0A167GLH0_9BACL|nr:ABC transporter ATP-binding protein [Paenibacillus crassostreae]AOZ92224.1 peptide ABC transporter ATP-binding protein [Paenibacillus crassostreae]OAB77686.1 peptide ABC transporter ATP-binding protein [Paenibacillus crassostreae]
MKDLLSVRNLKTSFMTRAGEVQSVRGVSFNVQSGDVIGIVGESGSGKSVTAKSIIGLIQPPGKIIDGQVLFNDKNLVTLSDKEIRQIRGNEISMIFQDPMTSLNPVVRIGKQLIEVIRRHSAIDKHAARQRAIELLREVGIPSPEQRIDQYPHEFSGGMRQRVMIAMALSCNPQLLIADEPTTALDVTIQAQILGLMSQLKERTNTAILLITHDLGVVAQVCTRVIVMYGGLIMEEGTVEEIFEQPRHPYTQGLLKSIPRVTSGGRQRLSTIDGTPPDLLNPPSGCPFMDRCSHAGSICKTMPHRTDFSNHHHAFCWLYESREGNDAKWREGEPT